MDEQPIHTIPGSIDIDPPKRNGLTIFLAILSAGLIITVILLTITINYMKPLVGVNITSNVTDAYNQGIKTTLNEILTKTNNCSVASVKYYNYSREIVDINCVRQLLIEQNITLK